MLTDLKNIRILMHDLENHLPVNWSPVGTVQEFREFIGSDIIRLTLLAYQQEKGATACINSFRPVECSSPEMVYHYSLTLEYMCYFALRTDAAKLFYGDVMSELREYIGEGMARFRMCITIPRNKIPADVKNKLQINETWMAESEDEECIDVYQQQFEYQCQDHTEIAENNIPERKRISEDDVLNLRIMLETTGDVKDFLGAL